MRVRVGRLVAYGILPTRIKIPDRIPQLPTDFVIYHFVLDATKTAKVHKGLRSKGYDHRDEALAVKVCTLFYERFAVLPLERFYYASLGDYCQYHQYDQRFAHVTMWHPQRKF